MGIQPAEFNKPFEQILYEKRDHIAYIALNRPERGNALAGEMQAYIRAVWDEVRDDPWIRCAVVTAAGERHFSTGADAGNVAAAGRVSSSNGPMSDEVFWSPRQNGYGSRSSWRSTGIRRAARPSVDR